MIILLSSDISGLSWENPTDLHLVNCWLFKKDINMSTDLQLHPGGQTPAYGQSPTPLAS